MPKDDDQQIDLTDYSFETLIKALEALKFELSSSRSAPLSIAIIDETIRRMTAMYDHFANLEEQLIDLQGMVSQVMKRLDK